MMTVGAAESVRRVGDTARLARYGADRAVASIEGTAEVALRALGPAVPLAVHVLVWYARRHIARSTRLLTASRKTATMKMGDDQAHLASSGTHLRSLIHEVHDNNSRLRDSLMVWEANVSQTTKRWWHDAWRRNLAGLVEAQDEFLAVLDDYTETLELAADQPFLDWLHKEIRENA